MSDHVQRAQRGLSSPRASPGNLPQAHPAATVPPALLLDSRTSCIGPRGVRAMVCFHPSSKRIALSAASMKNASVPVTSKEKLNFRLGVCRLSPRTSGFAAFSIPPPLFHPSRGSSPAHFALHSLFAATNLHTTACPLLYTSLRSAVRAQSFICTVPKT